VVEGAGLENRSTARYRRFESCPLRQTAAVLLLSLIGSAAAAADEAPKRKTAVTVRAAPRVTVAPARILFTAELKGGADDESTHCLTLQWAWGDDTTSKSEGDCTPLVAGETKTQRLFQADHEYRTPGKRRVQVTVLKGERVIGRDTIEVAIGPPKSDPTFTYRQH
jgi:hypothetical protein